MFDNINLDRSIINNIFDSINKIENYLQALKPITIYIPIQKHLTPF
jgi:hypothetical protein